MESFFATLKTERLSRKHYRTRDALCAYAKYPSNWGNAMSIFIRNLKDVL